MQKGPTGPLPGSGYILLCSLHIETIPSHLPFSAPPLHLLQSSLWSSFILYCWPSLLTHLTSYKDADYQTLLSACSVNSILGRKHKLQNWTPEAQV